MTLDRLTNAQLETLRDRLAAHANEAWDRMTASRTWFGVDQHLVVRAQLRNRIFNRADDLLYRRYTSLL